MIDFPDAGESISVRFTVQGRGRYIAWKSGHLDVDSWPRGCGREEKNAMCWTFQSDVVPKVIWSMIGTWRKWVNWPHVNVEELNAGTKALKAKALSRPRRLLRNPPKISGPIAQ